MRLLLGILTVLIYYLTHHSLKIPSALAALIIGALTPIFWDGMCHY
jgi:hypothetical protein